MSPTPRPRPGNEAARINGRRGITSSARTPLDALPVYKRNYVKARAQGSSVAQAATEAGVSQRQGYKYDQEAEIQEAYRYLVRQAVPAEELVALLRGGCYATQVETDTTGRLVEVPDWRVRKPYIELATLYGGYSQGKDQLQQSITIVVDHIGRLGGASAGQHTAQPGPPQLEAAAKAE